MLLVFCRRVLHKKVGFILLVARSKSRLTKVYNG
jgi:hypothetical protein